MMFLHHSSFLVLERLLSARGPPSPLFTAALNAPAPVILAPASRSAVDKTLGRSLAVGVAYFQTEYQNAAFFPARPTHCHYVRDVWVGTSMLGENDKDTRSFSQPEQKDGYGIESIAQYWRSDSDAHRSMPSVRKNTRTEYKKR